MLLVITCEILIHYCNLVYKNVFEFFFVFFFFLGPHLQHMEVARLGVKLEL